MHNLSREFPACYHLVHLLFNVVFLLNNLGCFHSHVEYHTVESFLLYLNGDVSIFAGLKRRSRSVVVVSLDFNNELTGQIGQGATDQQCSGLFLDLKFVLLVATPDSVEDLSK